MKIRDLLDKLTVLEGDVIPFPNKKKEPSAPEHEFVASNTQVLDADPDHFSMVVNVAKEYEKHKNMWFANKNPKDREIALLALESLVKWAEYFGYDEVEDMLAILKQNNAY